MRDLKQIAGAASDFADRLWSHHAEHRPVDPVQPDIVVLAATAEALPPRRAEATLAARTVDETGARSALAEPVRFTMFPA